MQCRGRHKSFVFNIRDACFIMKMKNVKKIDMNKKLYEQIKALLADKLDEKEQKELFHHRDRKSTRLNSSHKHRSRMPSSA